LLRIAAIALLALLVAACSEPDPPSRGRVLLVGIDGATNKLIDPLIEAGELPHFARLAHEGVRGTMRPEPPILSPRIWTTVVTGREPEVHGIEDWVKRGSAGRLRLHSSLDRRVPALWNILSARGRTVGVVNWLMTQPPDVVHGVIVSDHAVPGMVASRLPMAKDIANKRFGKQPGEVYAPEVAIAYAFPEAWVERSARIRAEQTTPLTDVPNPFDAPGWGPGPIAEFLRGVHRDDELTLRTALEVDAAERPELLLVYLPGVDRVSHLLWQGIEPPQAEGVPVHPEPLRSRHRSALRAYYRFTDALLGRLLEGFAAEDLIVVVSDHGFEAATNPVTMSGIHESDASRDGILFIRGPGIPAGQRVSPIAAVDVAPTVLAWLGLPLADDWPGKPADFLLVAATERVKSYDDIAVERVATPASDVEDDILEKLRTLGYVE
jgi:predicted AlkP superfamily phosphohydrolase/phosphomutase